jgi:hypothetical protein
MNSGDGARNPATTMAKGLFFGGLKKILTTHRNFGIYRENRKRVVGLLLTVSNTKSTEVFCVTIRIYVFNMQSRIILSAIYPDGTWFGHVAAHYPDF